VVVCVILSCQGRKSSTALFEEGQKLVEEKKYDEAIAKYQQGLAISPRSATGYNFLGMAYRFKYNAENDARLREKEMAAFAKAIELDSSFWVAYVNLGATYYYSGRKKEAAPYLERALELFPEHHEKDKILKMIEEGHNEGSGE
jgi:tetratricopeptide (TPR) repeat protein